MLLPQNMTVAMDDVTSLDFTVKRVGTPTLESHLTDVIFTDEDETVSYYAAPDVNQQLLQQGKKIPAFVAAGPRKLIYHDAQWTRAAIVTCGGICPGLNDVIKALVNTLYYTYGVDNIFGIQYGYSGLVPGNYKPMELTPDIVDDINMAGGTILSSSRGKQDPEEMVKMLDRLHINILFTIGGDGTQRGAHAIAEEIRKRNLAISVVGIPKTIDNDLNFMDKTFGFETAVQNAAPIITCAHNEAKGCRNGIGLVRLMGRDSGFVAAYATLANSLVNFCLIPEVPFALMGEHGFLPAIERRLDARHHAVVVVAEGAGQNFFMGEAATDKSGNKLHNDIGIFLKERILDYFQACGKEVSVKYFDPSYNIRSTPANAMDSVFCLLLAQHAVHAAMAGMTDILVARWNGYFTYVPIELATVCRRKIDPHGTLWQSVLLSTREDRYWR
ncbi:MAG: ATP-dependent 6-phosphofructokinase [Victivallales bacterium]|nr:ATP-dependent 6-phosphofructokinase [Victivallales bacterium]